MKNYTYKTIHDKKKNKKTKKLTGGNSSKYINYYLKNLRINSNESNIKDIIYNKSFPNGVEYFINAKKQIFNNKYINDLSNSSDKEFLILQKKWISCNSYCIQLLKKFMDHELASTAFVLRTLAESIITINKGFIQIDFSNENSDSITGKWKDDHKLFNISFIGVNKEESDKNTGRLIMGFGPSASGKTYWAKSIIQMFSMTDDNFPNTFMTIDGGSYRELSQIYQFIVRAVKRKGHGGLTNLVSSGMLSSSLFDSNIVKKHIVGFLLKNKDNCPISLYVPETLGACNMPFPKSCKDVMKNFISITKDEAWIGLNIYQHKHAADCEYDDEFKCVGCTESGMMRQTNEGKEYSNQAWGHSKKNGDKEIRTALGGQFIIHNSGGKKWTDLAGNSLFCKSIITELARQPIFNEEVKPIFNQELIPKIESKFNCVYFYKS